MASSPGRRLFVSRDPSVLERVRTGLTFPGAPPSAPSGAALDSTSALGRVNLSVLGLAVERLQSGPASAGSIRGRGEPMVCDLALFSGDQASL